MAEKPVVDEIDIETTLAEIGQARQRLGAAFAQLRQREVMNPLNIRAWVQRHPIESALGAAAAGFILAQPGGGKDGESPSILSDLSRSGIESILPFLLKTLL
jgi:hypothetical protein